MNATFVLWFPICVGGVLLVLEAAVTGITKLLLKRNFPEWATRLIAGAVISALALWKLWPN